MRPTKAKARYFARSQTLRSSGAVAVAIHLSPKRLSPTTAEHHIAKAANPLGFSLLARESGFAAGAVAVEIVSERLSGVRLLDACHLFRRPLSDHAAAILTAFRAKIDQP